MIRVAVGDIGTNTARLLVADVDGTHVDEVDVRTEVVGLGRGLHGTGFLQPEAMQRAADALGSFGPAFADADRSTIVATSASRDAENREAFFDMVEGAAGLRPTLIDGEQEAAYAFAGAAQAVAAERITVVDIGGGSTEFVTGRHRVEHAVSVDIGSVRLTDIHLGEGPVAAEVLAAGRSVARSLISAADLGHPGRTIGVAGTCTTAAGTLLGLSQHDRDRVHLSTIHILDVSRLITQLARLSVDEVARVGTIGAKRAPVILGGLLVLEASLEVLGSSEMLISERDLLHGVAIALVSP